MNGIWLDREGCVGSFRCLLTIYNICNKYGHFIKMYWKYLKTWL